MELTDRLCEWSLSQDSKAREIAGLVATGTLDYLVGTAHEVDGHLDVMKARYGVNAKGEVQSREAICGYVAGMAAGIGALWAVTSLIAPALWSAEFLTRMLSPYFRRTEKGGLAFPAGIVGLARELHAEATGHQEGIAGYAKEKWEDFNGFCGKAREYVLGKLSHSKDNPTEAA